MDILKIAASQLGVKEIVGNEDNPQIVAYAKETGITGVNNDEIPWCSTFVNWCAMKAGLPVSGKPNARSWVNVGSATKKPIPGDIVVFWRESIDSWKGHVGIFLGFNQDANRVFCLGGNQKNEVNFAEYDINKVLSYRKLSTTKNITVPEPVLKKGSKGMDVMKLQMALNHFEYHCGDVDGYFGLKTENALRLLQANNGITIDGIYGSETQNCIESLSSIPGVKFS